MPDVALSITFLLGALIAAVFYFSRRPKPPKPFDPPRRAPPRNLGERIAQRELAEEALRAWAENQITAPHPRLFDNMIIDLRKTIANSLRRGERRDLFRIPNQLQRLSLITSYDKGEYTTASCRDTLERYVREDPTGACARFKTWCSDNGLDVHLEVGAFTLNAHIRPKHPY